MKDHENYNVAIDVLDALITIIIGVFVYDIIVGTKLDWLMIGSIALVLFLKVLLEDVIAIDKES